MTNRNFNDIFNGVEGTVSNRPILIDNEELPGTPNVKPVVPDMPIPNPVPIDPVVPDVPENPPTSGEELLSSIIVRLYLHVNAKNFKYYYNGVWKEINNNDNEVLIIKLSVINDLKETTSIKLPIVALGMNGSNGWGYYENVFWGWSLEEDGDVIYKGGDTFILENEASKNTYNFYANFYSQEDIEKQYFYTVKVVGVDGNPVGGVGVVFYKEDVKQGEMTTGSNGIASFNYIISVPTLQKISVELKNVPNNYETPTSKFEVPPTTSSDVIGKTIELEYKYIKGIVTNEYSNSPIGGVNIKMVGITSQSVEEEIYDFNIGDDGKFSFLLPFGYQKFNVSFTHINYDNKIVNDVKHGDDLDIKLLPKYKIQVCSRTETDELQPAGGITIKIGYLRGNSISQSVKKESLPNGFVDVVDTSLMLDGERICAGLVDGFYGNSVKNTILEKDKINIIEIEDEEQPEPESFTNTFDIFKLMSANHIKNNINSNTFDAVKYVKSNDGETDFRIGVVEPDAINVFDIFVSSPVILQNNNKSILGSADICTKPNANDLSLKTLHRYSGYYNPIFKDVLFYKNYEITEGGEKKSCPFSNVSFDSEYKDRYGSFGIINNMWFHKVNEDKTKIIDNQIPYYPLIGQYALDYRDYNIFSNNRDSGYYTKQLDVETSKIIGSIDGVKDMLCMFGSKYINVPERLEIDGFDGASDWNDDWISDAYACPNEIMYREVNGNSVDFYFFLKKRIIRFFCEKIQKYFVNNIMYKYGMQNDIEKYVEKNILKLYELEKIRVFVKRKKVGQHDSTIENDYVSNIGEMSANLTKRGFIELKSVSMSKIDRDEFDRKLVYNLRRGEQETFGFSFSIRRI